MIHCPHVTTVIPARDEADTIADVVRALRGRRWRGRGLVAEVIVCDNGSRDATGARARAAGARVVHEPAAGYGAACQAALAALPPDTEAVLFVDADGSVEVGQAPLLLQALADGADLAVGARRDPKPGALTAVQRCGTGLVCWLIRRLWRRPVRDLGPFRAIRRGALERLGMTDRRFGWTAEMQVRAIQAGLRTVEVPVTVHPRAAGRSKISGRPLGVMRAGFGLVGTVIRLRLTQGRRGVGAPARVPWRGSKRIG